MNKVRKTLYGWAVVLAAFSALVVGCKDDDKPEPNPCAGLKVTTTTSLFQIDATAEGGSAPYQYSLDGTTFQTTGSFTVEEVKAYTLTVKDAKGCTTTAAVTAEAVSTYTDPRDQQGYKVVRIKGKNGATEIDQVWMAENFNLKVDSASWCYGNDAANCEKYGRLYTYYAAKAAVPEGWHLATDAELDLLVSYLGGPTVAGKALKLDGNSGFALTLAGIRDGDTESFTDEKSVGIYWTSKEEGLYDYLMVNTTDEVIFGKGVKPYFGFSVRYIKNK